MIRGQYSTGGDNQDLRDQHRGEQVERRRASAKELMQLAHDQLKQQDDPAATAEAEKAARQALATLRSIVGLG